MLLHQSTAFANAAPVYIQILFATAFASIYDGPPPKSDGSAPILSDHDCKRYFAGCTLIAPDNKIIGPRGILYSPEAFNSAFGGKLFMITPDGKTTDDAWRAATRSPLWTVPKVDGMRFMPNEPTGSITTDALGRTYVNRYIPAKIETIPGDVAPFLRHMELLLPHESDRRIVFDYLAHNVKYPGFKIPWAPLIQSTEGVGKNVIKQVMRYAVGSHYFYEPKAKQLNESGSKFNAWMEGRLFFIVDEIKTDEKRDMVETLKPVVTETQLEIEGKGLNQRMGDTPGNWLFFSNHKNAIPITKNGRRFAIFYSVIQDIADLHARGMDDAYFNGLYNWLGDNQNGGHFYGIKSVAHWLVNYPIERGAIDIRAPLTTSYNEAIEESRGWLAQLIADAIEDGVPGFRGGWISTAAVQRILSGQHKTVASRTMGEALKELGYFQIGQAGRGYFQDDPANAGKRAKLWNTNPDANLHDYGRAQGYPD